MIQDDEQNDEIGFEDLGLDEKTLKAIEKKGFKTPSPIQILAIPRLLTGESNMIAKARTGTGKTAAFGLPLVQKITQKNDFPQALILTPTRELCLQVCKEIESFATSSFPRMVPCYGGAGIADQIRTLKKGVEIVVGTPGRVQDLMERGVLSIDKIDYFILDEADEMLDMGFIDDIKAIFAKANADSRILLFSATMPKEILQIASDFMGDYEIIEEEKRPEEPLLTEQHYWFVRESDKIEALVRLIDISPDFYGLVFTQTKLDADNVSRQLEERGYEAAALHGDIAQSQREKILWRFRNKKTRILVATDVAARGIDIEGLTHVVNYALPFDAPTYIHRIGRTGRAGKTGIAYTFVRPEERRKLEFIKKASLKATKGQMKEDSIPSVSEVLKIKREKLFAQTKEKILASNLSSDLSSDFKTDSGADLASDFGSDFAGKTPFYEMAETLCEGKEPLQVLAKVLELNYGNALDESRYGKITPLKVEGKKGNGKDSGKNSVGSNQVRVYVQLGRADGYNARSIAEYFSDLLHIPQRLVDGIDVSNKFSLVTLPKREGLSIVERSKKDGKMPHMHFDTKSSSNFTGNSKNSRNSSFKNSSNGKNGSNGKSGFTGNREGGKKPLHVSKKANNFASHGNGQANLYKKG